MLKFLSYNHLFTYIALFLFTVLLRLPSFHTNTTRKDELFICSECIKDVDGGAQYVDTWDNKPPVLTWFYAFFVWIFGSGAIIAIRIFTCIYLFVSALLLNQFVVDNKLLDRFSLLPGFLLIFLSSVPWYAQELNGEILMNLPIILAVFQFLKLTERSRKNSSYLFLAGLLLGLCFMIKYQRSFCFWYAGGLLLHPNSTLIGNVFTGGRLFPERFCGHWNGVSEGRGLA